jgi:branched-chain amino acid aminotransferase
MSEIVYLDGSLVPASQARISVMDYGFLYGFGLFETMRAYGGQVFLLDRHVDRLASSAGELGLPVDTEELKKAVIDTLQANKLVDARVRITVSRGEGSMSPDTGASEKPTVLVTAANYHPYPDPTYRKGFSAIFSTIRRNSQSPLSRLKSTNYMESMLAKQEARSAGADEALFLNEKGLLAEASMSNIFLVDGGVLRTPGLENGILPGITRQMVLEMAPRLNIDCIEQGVKPEEIYHSGEAFLTNSLMEIMPLTGLDGKPIGMGSPGPVTGKLREEYRKMVAAATTTGQ